MVDDNVGLLVNLALETQREEIYQGTGGMHLSRGLYDNPSIIGFGTGYRTSLKFDLEAYIQHLLDTGGDEPVIAMDLGCGQAKYLSDLQNIFGDRIETFGISLIWFAHFIEEDHYIVGDLYDREDSNYVMDRIPSGICDVITMQNVDEPEDDQELKTFLEHVDRIRSPRGVAKLLGSNWFRKAYQVSHQSGISLEVKTTEPGYGDRPQVITIPKLDETLKVFNLAPQNY